MSDLLLPATERAALVQVIVTLVLVGMLAWAVRRERSLLLFVFGVGAVVLGLMSARTLH